MALKIGEIKRCSHCKVEKALSAYCKDAHASDGLQSTCRECRNQRNRERRQAKKNRPIPDFKTCRDCGHDLPGVEFYRQPDARDGLMVRCKACHTYIKNSHRAAGLGIKPPKMPARLAAARGLNPAQPAPEEVFTPTAAPPVEPAIIPVDPVPAALDHPGSTEPIPTVDVSWMVAEMSRMAAELAAERTHREIEARAASAMIEAERQTVEDLTRELAEAKALHGELEELAEHQDRELQELRRKLAAAPAAPELIPVEPELVSVDPWLNPVELEEIDLGGELTTSEIAGVKLPGNLRRHHAELRAIFERLEAGFGERAAREVLEDSLWRLKRYRNREDREAALALLLEMASDPTGGDRLSNTPMSPVGHETHKASGDKKLWLLWTLEGGAPRIVNLDRREHVYDRA